MLEVFVHLFQTTVGLRTYLAQRQESEHPGHTLGLVPTMGALHEGHLSLIRRARQENTQVVVSIFVNPLQFAANEDFQHYPHALEADQALCEAAGVDALFVPTVAELYGTEDPSDKAQLFQVVPPKGLISGLCGQFRPGHFEGVATVVTQLLTIMQPTRAYFGQKDAQQLAVLRQLAQALKLPVAIVGCPTVRDADGLALSSRNRYLDAEARSHAPALYRSLQAAHTQFQQGAITRSELIAAVQQDLATEPLIQLQYIDLVHPATMAPLEAVETEGLLALAAYVGSVRLIDNLVLRHRQPIIAIDGPAGSGKTTVAPQVAQRLGLLYLDTGAMYRAITWLVLQAAIAPTDEAAIAELVSQSQLHLERQEAEAGAPSLRVWANGQDVTAVIRTPEVTAQVSAIAAQRAVREALMRQQQDYGQRGGVVMDGRDIGTHVFPEAELKIFLTASVQERARRRQLDLKERGLGDFSLEDLEQAIYERDLKDSSRAIAPLRKAIDAIEINTDHLSIEAVVEHILRLYERAIVPPSLHHETTD